MQMKFLPINSSLVGFEAPITLYNNTTYGQRCTNKDKDKGILVDSRLKGQSESDIDVRTRIYGQGSTDKDVQTMKHGHQVDDILIN